MTPQGIGHTGYECNPRTRDFISGLEAHRTGGLPQGFPPDRTDTSDLGAF